MKLEDRKWKEFRIEDIFEIKKGNEKDMKKKVYNNKGINIVSAKTTNNGVVGNTDDFQGTIFDNVITITSDGTHCGSSFYQQEKFTATTSVSILKLKNKELNKELGIFLSTCISKLKVKYSYGFKLNSARLKKEKILLPVDENNQIDYDFMEEYIVLKEKEILPIKYIKSNKSEKIIKLEDKEWKEFIVEDILDIKMSKSLDIGKTKLSNEINYISRQSSNNGLKRIIEKPDKNFINEKNQLTTVCVGEPGITFYQNKDFCCSQNIIVSKIKDRELNEKIGIFLSTCITKIKSKYSYGYPISLKRFKKEKIWLPVDANNEIDYKFMEDYIKETNSKIKSKITKIFKTEE